MDPATLSLLLTAAAVVGRNVVGKPGQRRRRRRGQRAQLYRRGNEASERSTRRSSPSGVSRSDAG